MPVPVLWAGRRSGTTAELQIPQLCLVVQSMTSEVLPLPLTPVKATSRPLGMLTDASRRLLVRAPTTLMVSRDRLKT